MSNLHHFIAGMFLGFGFAVMALGYAILKADTWERWIVGEDEDEE